MVLWIFRVHFVCVWGGEEGEEAVQLVYTRKESLTKGETLARDLRKFDGWSFVWLVFFSLSLSFSSSLSLFYLVLFSSPFSLIFGGADPLWTIRNDGWKSRKKENVGRNEEEERFQRVFERSISGRKIARRTFHYPYFFASIAWTLAHYENNTRTCVEKN